MRARSGLITSLVFGVLLLLCAGGGVGAFILVSTLEGRGANTPAVAADTLLTGIFVERDEVKASKYLCSDIEPARITQKINEANRLLEREPDAKYSWEMSNKTQSKDKAVINATVTAQSAKRIISTQRLEITIISNGGWRVCGLKRTAS
jgi:hypothetical protein